MGVKSVGLKRNWETWGLAALLLAHVVLGVYWSVTIPIFEAHDEDGHYLFVRYLATEHQLPPQAADSGAKYDETHQPPLYYVLAALPVSLVHLEGEFVPRYNKYMKWPEAQGGRNAVIHDPALESWPYHGDVLAIHLARWVSVLLGALALAFTYLAARTLCPQEPWVRWGAVLVHAFWPQFRFTTAVINNDLMMVVCGAAVTWLAVRVVVAPRLKLADALALGAATGLALLSKDNALALVPVVVLVLLAKALVSGRAGRAAALAGVGGSLALGGGIVGWWYAHNVAKGAGIFGGVRGADYVRSRLASLLGHEPGQWQLIPRALRHGLQTWWAGFGWNNVALPLWMYTVAAIWAVFGLLGLAIAASRLLRCRRGKELGGVAALALLVSVVIGLALLSQISEGAAEVQGRTLLTATPAASVLLGLAWATLLREQSRRVGWTVMAGSLAALAVATPGLYIRPAYVLPPQLDEAEVASYTQVRATFGGFVELVGYRFGDANVSPGGRLRVTLLWRVLARTEGSYRLELVAFDEGGTLGEIRRNPGQGALVTTDWQPGYLFAEQAAIPIGTENAQGRQAWLKIKYSGPSDVEVRDGEGRSIGEALRIGGIRVRGPSQAKEAVPRDSLQFGSAIRLVAGQATLSHQGAHSQLELHLRWAAVERPSRDYTASLQLRDGDRMAAQQDGQLGEGTYATSFWEPGEFTQDAYALSLPARLADGTYTLYLCLYDPGTMQRLPVIDPAGGPQPGDEIALLTLTVAAGQQEVRSGYRLVGIE